jgi:uncharacterized membrane protein
VAHVPDGNLFVFLGTYASAEDARADYEIVKELHRAGALGAYDAAVVTRDADGGVHVAKDELPTRRGAWAGAAVGAVAGLLFPPSLLVSGAVGAGAGALVEHFRRGMSQSDVAELGELIGVGDAGLIVVADSTASRALGQALKRATTTIEKGLAADPELVAELAKPASTA